MDNELENGEKDADSEHELFAGEADLRKWLLDQNIAPEEVDDLIVETIQRLKRSR